MRAIREAFLFFVNCRFPRARSSRLSSMMAARRPGGSGVRTAGVDVEHFLTGNWESTAAALAVFQPVNSASGLYHGRNHWLVARRSRAV